jgi:hypothetical protein
MAVRVAGLLLVVPGCALAAVGAVHTTTDALIGWSLLGAGAGVLVALGLPRLRRGRQVGAGVAKPDVPAGVAAAAAFLWAYLVLAGLVVTVGAGFAVAVVLLLAVAGVSAWYHHRAKVLKVPATRVNPHDVIAAATLPASAVPVADMATEELCVAWRRSYFHLLLATDARIRRQVVQRRQDFLDEIERRDRRGFLRWLDSGARAGSDPGPYLTTRS